MDCQSLKRKQQGLDTDDSDADMKSDVVNNNNNKISKISNADIKMNKPTSPSPTAACTVPPINGSAKPGHASEKKTCDTEMNLSNSLPSEMNLPVFDINHELPFYLPFGYVGDVKSEDCNNQYEITYQCLGCFGRQHVVPYIIDPEENEALREYLSQKGLSVITACELSKNAQVNPPPAKPPASINTESEKSEFKKPKILQAKKAFGMNLFWPVSAIITVQFLGTWTAEQKEFVKNSAEQWINWTVDDSGSSTGNANKNETNDNKTKDNKAGGKATDMAVSLKTKAGVDTKTKANTDTKTTKTTTHSTNRPKQSAGPLKCGKLSVSFDWDTYNDPSKKLPET